MTQQITPFLWFDDNADEAVNFYLSIFKDSRLLDTKRYGETGPGPKGTIMTATFELNGQQFIALNGGPRYKFTEAVSFVVKCETQEEIDYYWDKLLDGGEPQRCGWLKDRFGLSWQIVPAQLSELFGGNDPQRAGRVMQAMMQMVKFDIAKLKQGYDG
jgi:predicted 3-demethylubiquinone-9 3-methyltransferase (glyoxalase superfamily)